MKQLFIFLSVVTGIAFGQITGDLQVSVTDPSAASVSSATVTIRNVDTGTTRTLTTDEAGRVRASQLETGRYNVQIARTGFETTNAISVVSSGSVATIQIALNVAKQQDQVVVVGEIPAINAVNAQLQLNVETADIRALPIAFSNQGMLQLATLSPGVTPVTSNNTFLGLGNYSSNGGRGRANNITIDGATATDISTTGGIATRTVPLDGVREVALITNQFTAEFGRNASSQFQILTRSGTNQIHGTAFGFFKNSALASRDYFDRTGKSTPNKDSDWGATAGGAIIKDKLFYFGTYEQQKVRGLGTTRVASVLTPADAATAGPFAQSVLSKYQVPTSASGKLAVNAPNTTDTKAFSGRLDANLTPRDYLYVRAGHSISTNIDTSLVFSTTSSLPANGASSKGSPWNATLSETHVFRPNLINTFLTSYERNNPEFLPLSSVLGPEVIVTGFNSFGPQNAYPQGRVQNTFQYQDSVSWTLGRHTLKFGGEVNRIQLNSYLDSFTRGLFTYNTLSDFLADKPAQFQQRFGTSMRGFHTWNHSLYAQDDFRITRTLTVNLGFRLEVASGTTEVNNLLSNIDPALTSTPIGGAGTGVLGAFYTGGSFYKTNYNPAPRFGFAWSPKGGKTVIRGGYGITYDFIYMNPITNGRTLPPLMYSLTLAQGSFNGNNTPARVFDGSSDFQKNGAALVGSFNPTQLNFGNVAYVDPNLRNPQVQQFSLTVERPIANNWTVRVSYSGSKGNYLQRTQQLNFMQAGLFTPPTSAADQKTQQDAGTYSNLNGGLTGSATRRSNRIDGRFNQVSAVTSGANSNYHSLQFSVSRRFTNGYMFNTAYTWSKSIDDVSDALGILANDNQGQQNPLDNRNNRAVSAFDITQRLVISHHFEPRVRVSNAFASHLLNGWQFAGIFQAQSGFPYLLRAGTVGGLADGLLLGGAGVQRPDLIGPFNLNWSPDSGGKNVSKVPGSGLDLPLVGRFGTLGRNVARWNPLINSDMTLGRTFRLTNSDNPLKFQVQAQVTNVFNNTTFSAPTAATSLTLSSPAVFGYYTGTELDTRRVLLVGRIIW